MYNVHDHNKNTLKAMCCRHSLAFVTWSDTQEASLSSQSLSVDIHQSGQCGWRSHRFNGLDGAATKPVDVRTEEVRSLKFNCIYVLTCLGGGGGGLFKHQDKRNLSGMNSAQDASSQVPAVAEAVLDELDVFQVIFDDADEVT